MDLTVILCTYNRCEELKDALAALARQRVTTGVQWEVLLVDNNSTDATRDVVSQFRRTFPVPLRYIYETSQGLSHARNRGIVEAQGRYVAFTEDDERSDELWVQAVLDTFEEYSCDAVAGRIELLWSDVRPAWLTDELLGFLGYLNYGETQVLTREKPPFGGNMAFNRDVFSKIGLFDTKLGRQGRNLIGGEETELFERTLRAGMVTIFQPKAVMHHVVRKNRLKKSYFRELHFNEGWVRGGHKIYNGKTIVGIPLFLLPQFYRSIVSFISEARVRGVTRSLRKEMIVWHFLGLILGCVQTRLVQRNLPT
jgi:glycosyltransferase involved in cell wall biosynthesis